MLLRRILLGVGLVCLASGCGALRFHRAWSSFEPSADAAAMEGRWKGAWRSEWNGHSGGLRCVMTPQDAEHYVAWFYSTYAALLFFQHQVVFAVEELDDGTLRFSGEQDLGRTIGGVYRYAGTIDRDEFHATYAAENGDHGVFELRRVE